MYEWYSADMLVSMHSSASVLLYRPSRTRCKRWVEWTKSKRPTKADDENSTIKVQWVYLQGQEGQLVYLVCYSFAIPVSIAQLMPCFLPSAGMGAAFTYVDRTVANIRRKEDAINGAAWVE
jgi:hypothetical protein